MRHVIEMKINPQMAIWPEKTTIPSMQRETRKKTTSIGQTKGTDQKDRTGQMYTRALNGIKGRRRERKKNQLKFLFSFRHFPHVMFSGDKGESGSKSKWEDKSNIEQFFFCFFFFKGTHVPLVQKKNILWMKQKIQETNWLPPTLSKT